MLKKSVSAIAICLWLPILLSGERPTIFSLTTANGLISNSGIFSMEQDPQGYLWIGTHEGVSRFDGSEFRNYGVTEGFDAPAQVHSILIRRNGEIWTAMNMARYSPMADRSHRFQYLRDLRLAQFLKEEKDGRIWALGPKALYRSVQRGQVPVFERVCLAAQNPCQDGGEIGDGFELAADGSLWIANIKGGVIHRFTSGQVERFGAAEGLPLVVLSFLCDRERRMWVGTSDGVFRFVSHPVPGRLSVEPKWGTKDGFASCAVYALRQTRDGHVWAGGRCGLVELDDDHVKRYTTSDGLSQNVIESILEDRDGDLWLGTESAGLMRMKRAGVSTFGEEAGLEQNVIDGLSLARDGRVVVVTNRDGRLSALIGNEAGFQPVLPPLPLQPTDLDVQHWQVIMQDHQGDWWVPGKNEIRIFGQTQTQGNAAATLKRRIDQRSGLLQGRIDCMLEDEAGNVWLGIYGPPHSTLVEWIRSTGEFRSWENKPGVPADSVPVTLTKTRSGSVWIAYRGGGLGRYKNGRHLLVLPDHYGRGQVMFAIAEDDLGRLWAGRSGGVLYQIEDPDSDHPRARQLPRIHAPFLRCILSDREGRLYLGSEAGLIQYDPATGAAREFHERDGLPSDVVQNGTRTRDGALWFGTGRGLMRFEPRSSVPEPRPPVWIDVLDVGGAPAATLSDRGEQTVSRVSMTATGSNLRIGFHSINFHHEVRFQYKLVPGDRDWSAAVAEKFVTYPRLRAGDYQFAVRAVLAGTGPGQPATVSFAVLPPIWLRAWFLSLVAVSLALLLAALHRYRVAQLLRVERLRMRIAADLHDDLGASLTQIAVVSDQLQKDYHRNGNVNEALGSIAEAAREMTSALGDVVWSIGPERDHLADLLSRMRRLGNDLCEAHRIQFSFAHPGDEGMLSVDGQTRRNVFLIFKESLRNAVRHSRCRHFEVVCTASRRSLTFVFEDDGIGFDSQQIDVGQGLASMRQRARTMKGSLRVQSSCGNGARVELVLPVQPKVLRGLGQGK